MSLQEQQSTIATLEEMLKIQSNHFPFKQKCVHLIRLVYAF